MLREKKMIINKKHRRHKVSGLTYYVIFSITMLITYTVAELLLSNINGTINDTLTTCFFATFGGEILTCAVIKIFKLKEENKYE